MLLNRPGLLLGLVSLTAQSALAASSSFNLWVYGPDGIGGYPLLEKDGLAYAVKPEVAQNHPEYLTVNFTKDTSDETIWIATPANSSLSSNETLKLGVDTDANANGAVGFAAQANSSWTISGWLFYGSTVLFESSSGSLSSNFFANNNTDVEGVWALTWDSGDETEGVPVALRKVGRSLTAS